MGTIRGIYLEKNKLQKNTSLNNLTVWWINRKKSNKLTSLTNFEIQWPNPNFHLLPLASFSFHSGSTCPAVTRITAGMTIYQLKKKLPNKTLPSLPTKHYPLMRVNLYASISKADTCSRTHARLGSRYTKGRHTRSDPVRIIVMTRLWQLGEMLWIRFYDYLYGRVLRDFYVDINGFRH